MDRDGYLSTGEAAKLLNISRSTVSRRFDLGIFEGKLNPITGERLISVDSVKKFMASHDLPVDSPLLNQKRVVLGTALDDLRTAVKNAVGPDKRITMEAAELGTDTLVACSKTAPHLLILDERLPDIGCGHIIDSLRKQEDQKSLKILCCLRDTAADKAGTWGADGCLDIGSHINAKELRRRIYRLLGMRRDIAADVNATEHKRQWPRIQTDIPAKVGVYRLSSPYECKWGTAVIRNISEGGAYLSNIQFEDKVLPAEPFKLLMKIEEAPLDHCQADCQVVRMDAQESLCVGVKFANISTSTRQRIAELSAA